MGIIFHPEIAQNGSITVNVGTGAPVNPVLCQGLLLDDTGAVYCTTTGPATTYSNGLPFDASGRLYIEDAAVTYYSQSIPFTANNAVAVSGTDAGGHYSQGMQFGPAGGIFVSAGLGPAFTNFVLITMGASGLEAWDMDQSPYALVTPISPLPEASLYGVAYDPVNQRVAVGGTQVHIYDTTTYPFTFVTSVTLSGDTYNFLRFAPNGETLCAGVYDAAVARNTHLIDMSDFSNVVLTADSINGVDFTSDSNTILFSRQAGTGNGLQVFDITDPALPVADTGYPGEGSTGYRCMTMKRSTAGMFTCFVAANDIYEINQTAKTFTGVFDANSQPGDLAFTPNSNFFGMLERVTPFMQIFDSSAASSGSWTVIPFDTGANIAGNGSNITRPWLAVSNDNQFMGLWQTSDGADQNRIVWDLTTNPIQRVTAFGGTGGSGFERMAFVRAP